MVSASKSYSEQNRRKYKIQNVGNNDLLEDKEDELRLFKIGQENPEPSIIIPVKMKWATYSIKLDTGASVSIMSEESWNRNFADLLEKSQVKLKTYTGETLDVIGQARVNVSYEKQTVKLPIQNVKGNGPSLFGRNWLWSIQLNWWTIKMISSDIDNVLAKHNIVFKDELGTMDWFRAKVYIKSDWWIDQELNKKYCNKNSREFVTINTHKGLYRPTRLPFGVSTASAIFQSKIEQVLQGIPMVLCKVDGILISGRNYQEHLKK